MCTHFAPSQVDGCAIFWRRAKFRLAENYTVEFNECARRAVSAMPGLMQEEAHQFLMRVSKDNVAQVHVIEAYVIVFSLCWHTQIGIERRAYSRGFFSAVGCFF